MAEQKTSRREARAAERAAASRRFDREKPDHKRTRRAVRALTGRDTRDA